MNTNLIVVRNASSNRLERCRMKKLTDEEIIKALECCASTSKECDECPLENVSGSICQSIVCKNVLNLIKYQKAEIERLQNIIICFMEALGKVRKLDDIDEISSIPILSELNKEIRASVKSEAYKEFAERLKRERARGWNILGKEHLSVYVEEIDDLLKEMVGEE